MPSQKVKISKNSMIKKGSKTKRTCHLKKNKDQSRTKNNQQNQINTNNSFTSPCQVPATTLNDLYESLFGRSYDEAGFFNFNYDRNTYRQCGQEN